MYSKVLYDLQNDACHKHNNSEKLKILTTVQLLSKLRFCKRSFVKISMVERWELGIIVSNKPNTFIELMFLIFWCTGGPSANIDGCPNKPIVIYRYLLERRQS